MELRKWIRNQDIDNKFLATMMLVNSVAISSDSKYIVSGGDDKTIKIWNDKTIKIWNLESGQEIKTLTGHNDALESGQEIKTLAGHSKSVDSVAISSDNKYIVSGSDVIIPLKYGIQKVDKKLRH
eukprot:TRINITY_DN613_c0_g1_i34.p2 TRINITY_DN613_c0_g1~~TRINITY_DN613_c0_g1_i34.p2  ORF type:complete len:125 (-),score=30.25 TRINITY_DN613_c0_g1_i34:40-414(-)